MDVGQRWVRGRPPRVGGRPKGGEREALRAMGGFGVGWLGPLVGPTGQTNRPGAGGA